MSFDLKIVPYSEKSFKVEGADTKTHCEELKNLNGRYNPKLKGGPGWIFSNKRRSSVEDFISSLIKRASEDSEISEEVSEDSEVSEESSEDERKFENLYENFNVGDKVAINTSSNGRHNYIFGKVMRKTNRTILILTYKVEKVEIYAGPAGYTDDVSPNWDVSLGKVRAWKCKDNSYYYEKYSIVSHYDPPYQNCDYY